MTILNQMNDMRNSIARKLAIRISAILAAAFLLLLVGVLLSLKRQVKIESEHYAKALLAGYSDMVVYESNCLGRPLDITFSDRLVFFGKYMCSWYRMDYFYVYVPDFEKGTITYLSVVRNRNKFGDLYDDQMVGVTEKHIMSGEELRAWNDTTYLAKVWNDRFDGGTDVLKSIVDGFGNRSMVGTSISEDELVRDVMRGFLVASVFTFLIVAVLACFLYLLIRRMVTDPARRISKKMSEYISDGKKSKIKLENDDDDEFSMMAQAFNNMTGDMEKYIDNIACLEREKERQQAEVDIAYDIQKGILRAGDALFRNCGIKAVMKPAKYVGGDLYDYLELDGSRTMIVVADVSGKGIPSAMFMAVALNLIRQFARMGYSPAGILKGVNDTLSEENPKMMFVTAFLAIYDAENATLTYSNAGHNPPYLIHDVPEVLDASDGTPIGLFREEEYKDVVVRMEEGDSVFLYTDGVVEAVNGSSEFYGTERLEGVLAKAGSEGDKYYIGAVEESVRSFSAGAEQNDDITMLALNARRNPVLELGYDISEFALIRDRLFSSGLPKPLLMDLCVAAEECFVNICSYAFDGPAPEGEKILFYFEYSNNLIMRFSDGGKPFDPRTDLPDTDEYDIDTAVGGLGRLIAFTVADSVDYEYRDGRNILTITKSLNSI